MCKEIKTLSCRDNYTSIFFAVLFILAVIWKFDTVIGWMDKDVDDVENIVIISSLRKEGNLAMDELGGQ